MLPVQLEVKNFLAYRNPDPLLFEGIHLACLSGANGAGKSSILDAITWVIWGKSRARSDDDLIFSGEDETQVMLDFMQGTARYRILRKRKLGRARKDGRRGAGNTTLDFFAFDSQANVYRLINEPSVRDTQNRIIDMLSLDYETFVNSAFLQQGQADAFTIKPPAQRKEILVEILGLNRWQAYEDHAKQELRNIENELAGIQFNLDSIERDVAEEPAVQENLEAAQLDLQELKNALDEAQEAYNELAGVDKEMQSAQSEMDNIKRMVNEQKKNIRDAEAEIERNLQRLEQYQEIIGRRDSIEDGYQQLQHAREANEALADALRDLNNVEKRIATLERGIDQERQNLELEISQHETRIEESQGLAENVETIQDELDSVLKELHDLKSIEEERDQLQAELAQLGEERAALETENKALHLEMDDLKMRIDTLDSAREALCPVCGQALTAEHREKLVEELRHEGVERGDLWRANKDRIKAIGEEVAAHQAQIKACIEALVGKDKLGSLQGSLEEQLKNAEQGAKRANTLQGELDKLLKKIQTNNYAHELRDQLADVQREQERLAYDPDVHEAIRETLETYRDYQDQANALSVALDAVPDIEKSLDNARERGLRWQEMLEENEAKVEGIIATMEALQVKVSEMERRRQHLAHQTTLHAQAQERVGAFKQRLSSIENARKRAIQLEERAENLREESSMLDQLKKAFGKDGIPAMIIDAAIPELEDTANQLLRKMTSGRMTVRFDTQREKKTGGVAETFDIWISDELGTRDYSMYSGGEAFRVNFAIRVAISQLLARRAGAQLRTLFIDEGFGTQDEEGRARLAEAINVIQDDFDLILVITHIDELRDAFPVRIEIEKREGGSLIHVM